MPVTIRSAATDDVPAILAIEREAASAAHWTAEQYGQRVAEGMIVVAELVAEEKPGVSGFVCGRVVAGEWELENIVVAASSRRRGVADTLLQEFLRRARAQAGVSVWLEVRESNRAARRLYEKYEFREIGRRREYYRDPGEDAVLYELGFQRAIDVTV